MGLPLRMRSLLQLLAAVIICSRHLVESRPTSSLPVILGSYNSSTSECRAAPNCKPSGQLHAPPVSKKTPATLTVNGFGKGGSGGGAAACDGKFHSDKDLIVALSTGWLDKRSRCGKSIVISANNKKVEAKVVDECDSFRGCDKEHAFQPPCAPNIVDASPAVWKQLGVPPGSKKFGFMDVTSQSDPDRCIV